jgi:hypothetical protein
MDLNPRIGHGHSMLNRLAPARSLPVHCPPEERSRPTPHLFAIDDHDHSLTIMKIYSLAVILAPPSGPSATLSQASDLSSFSFYQKGSVGEFMSFFTKTVVERTAQGMRQSIQENNYTAHVYNRGGAEQLAG